jgi:hypothetical protein
MNWVTLLGRMGGLAKIDVLYCERVLADYQETRTFVLVDFRHSEGHHGKAVWMCSVRMRFRFWQSFERCEGW